MEETGTMIKLSKKDSLLAAVIGFLVAVILLLIGANVAVAIPTGVGIVVIFPILSIVGLWVASLVARKIFIIWQIAKFALVGALNTFVDLGVLNLLIFITGIAEGVGFSAFKGLAFVVAVINSYYWNKIWTFKAREGGFFAFFVVSVIGLLINVGVASLVVNAIGAPGDISANLWANVGAIIATFVALAWNFVGYKLFVFKK